MAVEVFATIGGDGDADRAGHFAIGVGFDDREVVMFDALAPEQADGFLELFGFDADVAALFGEIAGQMTRRPSTVSLLSLASVRGPSSFSSKAPAKALISRPFRARAASAMRSAASREAMGEGDMMGSWQRLQRKIGTAKPSADTRPKKLGSMQRRSGRTGNRPDGQNDQAGLMQPDGQTSTHNGNRCGRRIPYRWRRRSCRRSCRN